MAEKFENVAEAHLRFKYETTRRLIDKIKGLIAKIEDTLKEHHESIARIEARASNAQTPKEQQSFRFEIETIERLIRHSEKDLREQEENLTELEGELKQYGEDIIENFKPDISKPPH